MMSPYFWFGFAAMFLTVLLYDIYKWHKSKKLAATSRMNEANERIQDATTKIDAIHRTLTVTRNKVSDLHDEANHIHDLHDDLDEALDRLHEKLQ